MTSITRRRPTTPFTDLLDWFETWPPVTDWRHDGMHAVRVEERMEEGRYVLRAELPGIDPEKDVTVSVTDRVLTIRAERREETRTDGRSEFQYGSFERFVTPCRAGSAAPGDEDGLEDVPSRPGSSRSAGRPSRDRCPGRRGVPAPSRRFRATHRQDGRACDPARRQVVERRRRCANAYSVVAVGSAAWRPAAAAPRRRRACWP